jgi:alkylation response protein AidB-like acyl-CoA dehydrogenase
VLDHDDEPDASLSSAQRMPLLVGLADASAVRRNPDLPLHTLSNGMTGGGMTNGRVVFDDDDPASRVDLAELVERQKTGGNLMDSMFNMANSILGAGEFGCVGWRLCRGGWLAAPGWDVEIPARRNHF